VDVAFVMVHEPLTNVIAKFAEPPVTVGVIAPVPATGPTEAGLSAQVSPVVNEPANVQAEGVRAAPLYTPVKLPAVAVTIAGAIVNVAVFVFPVWLVSPA